MIALQKPPSRPADSLSRTAFLGSAQLPIADSSLWIQVLIWPIVPNAWRLLDQTWEAVGGRREATGAGGKSIGPSWIADCAPQLGAPFCGTTAEESTIAAILSRTAMSIAIAVVNDAPAGNAGLRQSLLQCLSSYDEYVKIPGHLPCSILVARQHGTAATEARADAFAHSRKWLPNASWLQQMKLCPCDSAPEPLALELTHVIAALVARYRADGEGANPIAEAVRSKLAHPFHLLDHPVAKRRR